MWDLLEEVVEVRPLEEPVEEPQEFSLVQHLEAAHRRLQVQVEVKAGAAVQVKQTMDVRTKELLTSMWHEVWHVLS